VWGSPPYYCEGSNLCSAALHAGIITPIGGVFLTCKSGKQDNFEGSFRHGVKSESYRAYPSSFEISASEVAIPPLVGRHCTLFDLLTRFVEPHVNLTRERDALQQQVAGLQQILAHRNDREKLTELGVILDVFATLEARHGVLTEQVVAEFKADFVSRVDARVASFRETLAHLQQVLATTRATLQNVNLPAAGREAVTSVIQAQITDLENEVARWETSRDRFLPKQGGQI